MRSCGDRWLLPSRPCGVASVFCFLGRARSVSEIVEIESVSDSYSLYFLTRAEGAEIGMSGDLA